ncbi:cation:proton antiporter [Sandaracinus amylolyticus]|uniref:cation:proton antiporter domain-containing protein n=1 Tax=Sandaracinus amylolyticus TaxID=927083 RepID=UPI001F022A29|nr:cation:proton antiporter [Sandaracinus amylolyticus]UJR80182.1 Inner membrane protein YbaL [Sandaracinus amylolyticus]
MHELPLLTTTGVALLTALVGGLVARRIGLPSIVGYMLAGIAIAPRTPGFVGDTDTMAQLAELGVVLLMFGVGAHFSFRDLWRVRSVAVPGAIVQMLASTALAYGIARAWGWSPGSSILLGIAVSIASTVVLLRALMERGLIDTAHGRVAVGWLVLEDLATVVLLVMLPAIFGHRDVGVEDVAWAVGKAIAFVVLMMTIGGRIVSAVLRAVARTRSHELFVLAALTLALGTALASAHFFGVSLALGAFVAGVIVGESRFGHQVSADLVPFRDAFAVLFFVSIGMLVEPAYLAAHALEVVALTAIVVVGKLVIAGAIVLALGSPLRTALVVGAGLAQIGEFSFIVGQAGVRLGILEGEQYSLILAVAIVSITLNPLVFRVVERLEAALAGTRLARARARAKHPTSADTAALDGHVVIVGYGRVGAHVVDVLDALRIPMLVVENDTERFDAITKRGCAATLFGDASSPEVLDRCALDRARALVVALSSSAATDLVVSRVREAAPSLHILARAASRAHAEDVITRGATESVDPQLEGGLELVRRLLVSLHVPIAVAQREADVLRVREQRRSSERARVVDEVLRGAPGLEVAWVRVQPESEVVGRTLAEAQLRTRTGVSAVAIARDEDLLPNPSPSTRLRAEDSIAVIGARAQIDAAIRWLSELHPPAGASEA